MNVPGYPKQEITRLGGQYAAVQLPSVASVMRDVARMTYAQHVKLAEALGVTPQALNVAVERHFRTPPEKAVAGIDSLGRPVTQGTLDGLKEAGLSGVATARGYFKESADG